MALALVSAPADAQVFKPKGKKPAAAKTEKKAGKVKKQPRTSPTKKRVTKKKKKKARASESESASNETDSDYVKIWDDDTIE